MNETINGLISNIQYIFGKTEYVKIIKTGKEASVHLLNVNGNLRALKIYKQNTKFSSRNDYFQIAEIGDSRMERAVRNRSKAGKTFMTNSWVNREYAVMEELNNWNAYVPKVYHLLDNAILMDYLGDVDKSAPRLADVHLEKKKSEEVYSIVVDHINLFKNLGFVHGDLSIYNILWFEEKPYIIDFPQVVYIESNKNWYEKYRADMQNVRQILGRS